ncbi:MAG: MAPEG family protein, partial [Alphaproteobacteria bacterium]
MTIEFQILVWSTILGLVQIILAAHFASHQYGYRWAASSRDQIMPPLQGVAGRLNRALYNFLETFPFFVTAVLV